MDEQRSEKLVYQYATNYRAHRRLLLLTRVGITVVAVGGALGLIAVSWVLALIAAVMLASAGAISVIVSLHNERTLIVFNTRAVFINRDKRAGVMFSDVVSVEYKPAFYARDLMTGTLVIKARTNNGRLKTYKMRHMFDGATGAAFIRGEVDRLKAEGAKDEQV